MGGKDPPQSDRADPGGPGKWDQVAEGFGYRGTRIDDPTVACSRTRTHARPLSLATRDARTPREAGRNVVECLLCEIEAAVGDEPRSVTLRASRERIEAASCDGDKDLGST